jgi:hypothetical protein
MTFHNEYIRTTKRTSLRRKWSLVAFRVQNERNDAEYREKAKNIAQKCRFLQHFERFISVTELAAIWRFHSVIETTAHPSSRQTQNDIHTNIKSATPDQQAFVTSTVNPVVDTNKHSKMLILEPNAFFVTICQKR